MNRIFFHEIAVNSKLQSKKLLRTYIASIFQKEVSSVERVDIIFVSDEYLSNLNQRFLSADDYTDTISFTLNANPLLGEVYISPDRIKENSIQLQIPYQIELVRVIIHGCLHLAGYSDKKHKHAKIMTSLQEQYLHHWLVSRETQIG